MKTLTRIGILVIALLALCLPVCAEGAVLDSLRPEAIAGARINLNPWGARIGFEVEFDGADPRLGPLVTVLREAIPGTGHRCANAGAVRFRMADGGVIGVGLLPGHEPGLYEVRLYDADRYAGVYRVDRERLLAALARLGLPLEDPAFRQ